MEWSAEISRLDNEVYNVIVKEKNLKKLKKLFKDASSLVEYSNLVAPYPHRRESVLSLLVQANDADFFGRVWDGYFSKPETKELQEKFLRGTTSTGQRLNYHYFQNVMPPEVLLEAEIFCETDPQKVKLLQQRLKYQSPLPVRQSKEKLERWKIYEQIKTHFLDVYDDLDFVSHKIKADGKQLVEEISGSGFVWNKRHYPFSEILFRKNEGVNKFGQIVSLGRVSGLITDGTEPLLPQVFRKLDFPECFFWAKEMLLRVDDMLKTRHEVEYADELLRFFEIRDGFLVIDDKVFTREHKNSKDDMSCKAYFGTTKNNRLVFGVVSEHLRFDDEISSRKVMTHELTHAAERVGKNEKNVKAFADTDLMKFSFMVLYLREKGKLKGNTLQEVFEEVISGYKKDFYVSETLARMMEPRDYTKEPLVKNIREIFMCYQRARFNHNDGIVKYIDTMAERSLPNYKKVMSLYEKFEDFLETEVKFREQEYKRFFRPTKMEISSQEYSHELASFYRLYLSVWRSKKSVKLLERMTSKALKDLRKLDNEIPKSKYTMFWQNIFCRSK